MTGSDLAEGAMADVRRLVLVLCAAIMGMGVALFFAAHQIHERDDMLAQCLTETRRAGEVGEFCAEGLERCSRQLKACVESEWRADL